MDETMVKVEFIARRLIFVDDLKNLCEKQKWYTMGDSESFSRLLDKCRKANITVDDMIEIAKDIHLHSRQSDMDFTEFCNEIAEISHTYFERVIIDMSDCAGCEKIQKISDIL